ncbi:MAG: hypothetical protein ABI316_04870 [Casimicrobiaceae bacterium]
MVGRRIAQSLRPARFTPRLADPAHRAAAAAAHPIPEWDRTLHPEKYRPPPETNLTMTEMVMGTSSYMSPEQCRGLPSDRRADVFNTGVVLYELLTGVRPFAGSMEAVTYKICHEHPRPPSQIARFELPPSLDGVIARALAKDPADRFPDARAFQLALRLAGGDATGAGDTAHDSDEFVRLVAEHIGTQERNAFLREIAAE